MRLRQLRLRLTEVKHMILIQTIPDHMVMVRCTLGSSGTLLPHLHIWSFLNHHSSSFVFDFSSSTDDAWVIDDARIYLMAWMNANMPAPPAASDVNSSSGIFPGWKSHLVGWWEGRPIRGHYSCHVIPLYQSAVSMVRGKNTQSAEWDKTVKRIPETSYIQGWGLIKVSTLK